MSSSRDEAAALALLQSGRLLEAEAAWREIARVNPNDARALNFLGCTVAASGRLDEALTLLDRSLRLAPRNASFLNNRARVLQDAGRIEDAVADLRRAVSLDPGFAAAHLNLGTLLRGLGRGEEALRAFGKAAALEPNSFAAHAALGRLQYDTGHFAAASESFGRALRLRDDPEILNNLALALKAVGQEEAAMACLRQALAKRPGLVDAMVNLGNLLKDRGDVEGAMREYRRALAERPQHVEAMLNLGHAARESGQPEEARRLYEKALEERPDSLDALLSAAGAALDGEDLARSRALYERALRSYPESADARYGMAQIALREQRFDEGWQQYECRFRTRPPQATVRDLGLPRLTREAIGRTRAVAVCAEQGIGDQILFASLLPELAERGIGAVVEVDARLKPLLERSFPGLRFVAREAGPEAFSDCDAQIPMGSLPSLFRNERSSFQRQRESFLVPDPHRVSRIRSELQGARWLGISWRSIQKGARSALAARKSIPLECFHVLERAGLTRLLDLQYGDVEEERGQFELRHPGLLERLPGLDTWNDVEGVAAAIAACDGIVTGSNVTAHLAGALGKPTTVLFLRGWPPFPYWTSAGGRSLWYPSVRTSDPSWLTWEQALSAAASGM